jgi:hypothetical protein
MARSLLCKTNMMQTGPEKKKSLTSLTHWLDAVNDHLTVRRTENRTIPRPKRNRERERARREARQLFVQYYTEKAVDLAA